jgi:hypothetical protein
MTVLELKTPEATFKNDMDRACHFMIDCGCGGRNGEYSGSHYKNADPSAEKNTRAYQPLEKNAELKHTFYLSESTFCQILGHHKRAHNGEPLIIVCTDCGREFPFTPDSYSKLRDRMMSEYNRRVCEEQVE